MLEANLKTENENQPKLCKRCHRKLKDDNSILLGYGPTCYRKVKSHTETYLFKMEDKNE